jgi:hypothetical protein
VEAVHRILTGQTWTVGVATAGEIFYASDILCARFSHTGPASIRRRGGSGHQPAARPEGALA